MSALSPALLAQPICLQTSLWSLAAATTAISCYLAYLSFDFVQNVGVSGCLGVQAPYMLGMPTMQAAQPSRCRMAPKATSRRTPGPSSRASASPPLETSYACLWGITCEAARHTLCRRASLGASVGSACKARLNTFAKAKGRVGCPNCPSPVQVPVETCGGCRRLRQYAPVSGALAQPLWRKERLLCCTHSSAGSPLWALLHVHRPSRAVDARPAGTSINPFAPQRPIEWAFLGSILLASAGTVIGG